MARILAYTSPARGHLLPLTPVLIELARRGHQISLRTLASDVDSMRSLGFQAEAISPQIGARQLDDWRGGSPQKALKLAVQAFLYRSQYDAADLRSAIETERPDALLVDVNAWGAMAAAEAWGGPWAVFCPYPLPLSSPDVPPYGPGLAPARGPLGRLRDLALRPLVVGTIQRTMTPALNQVRAQLGLAPLAKVDDLFRRPPLLIYMTAEPFEYPRRDWPQSVVMVGPCEWEPAVPLPQSLQESKRPFILVTTSSEFQNDQRLVEAALEGLANEPYMVVATVPAGEPGTLRVPANAVVERFIPHGPVLDRAVCAVTHGGMGATQKALARGVPVCAVPFGRDQLEVARRLEVSSSGTRLPAKRLTPQRLRQKVREAIDMREGALRIAQAFKEAGGARTAADAVESRLLSAPVSLGSPR